jgi:hypothetical protein
MAKLREKKQLWSRSSSIQITLSRKEEKSYKGKSIESRKGMDSHKRELG